MFSQRLKQLRLARGLSLDALAAQMGGAVTKQALSKYEQGRAKPTPLVLTKLAAALSVKAAHLWSTPVVRVEMLSYRKRTSLLRSEQARIESLVAEALEGRVRVQELTQQTEPLDLNVRSVPVGDLEDAERAAERLRERWDMGCDPIASVVGCLEDHRVHVLQIGASDKFDGIAAVAYEGERVAAAAVVTRDGLAGERQRLNLAHELGHLVVDVEDDEMNEAAAFRFGAAFLFPEEAVRGEVGDRRAIVQPAEVYALKQKWGLSMQAIVRRLRDLEIISDAHYRQWCIYVNQQGWRKEEPGEFPPEQPQWLRQRVYRALAEGAMAADEASRILGERPGAEDPLSLVERRAFMRLPIHERRRVMAAQAERFGRGREPDESATAVGGGG